MRTILAIMFALGLSTAAFADVVPNELEKSVDHFENAYRILDDMSSPQ